MRWSSRTLALALIICSTSPLLAQRRYRGRDRAYGGYDSYHASTAAEGYARGMADVVRSAGEASLMNSEALINVEDARKQRIENRVTGTQAYFDMKRINQEYQQSRKKPSPTAEDMARYALERQPNRLGTHKLDPLTGEIRWPAALLDDSFQKYRDALNDMFLSRAERSYFTPQQAKEARKLSDKMREMLGQGIRDNTYSPAEGVEGLSFLRSLKFETKMAPS